MHSEPPGFDRTTRRTTAFWAGASALLAALVLALLAVVSCNPSAGRMDDAPIILISVDTLRADHLPAYGYEGVATPVLDALSRESVVFDNAYAHVPLTLPSHSSLLSGLVPPLHGVRDNLGYPFDGNRHPTLPLLLKQAGYVSGAAVSAYVLHSGTGLGTGFDMYDDDFETRGDRPADRVERGGDATVARALEWIRGREDRRFFFFLHLFEPHDPYEPPEPYFSRYENHYDGEIAWTDEILGRFLDRLREEGLYDKALIFFLSDHGEGLGDHGEQRHGLLLYREVLHVPLMMKLPHGRLGGTRVTRPAQLIDVVPTVLGLLGITLPGELEGTSLVRLAEAHDGAHDGALDNRRIYGETLYGRIHYGWSELRSIIDSKYHYIESPNPELFDLVKDPGETVNVLSDERRPFFELRRALETYPTGFEAPAAADPEEAARLMALGYLASAAPDTDGPRPDPKENLHVVDAVQRAVDLRAAGRYEEAVAELRSLLEMHPEVQDAHLLLAPALRALGRNEEALEACRRALQVLPTLEPLISLEMAHADLALGRYQEAAARAAAGESVDAAQSFELRARAALGQGDLDAALSAVRKGLVAGQPPRLPSLLLAAEIQMRREDPQGALTYLEQAHRQAADGSAAAVPGLEAARGDALARLGRYDEAERAFLEEIRSFPANTQAYTRLAVVYASTRRFDRIEPLLEAMAAASPAPATFALAADTLERLGNTEGAARWRERARSLSH